MCLLFLEIYKRPLAWHSPNTLPTMDQDQAFRIVTWITPSRGLPLSEDALSSTVGLSLGKYKRYPEYDYLILCRIRDKSKIYQIMYGGSYCLFNLFHSYKLIYFFYFQQNSVDKEKSKNI